MKSRANQFAVLGWSLVAVCGLTSMSSAATVGLNFTGNDQTFNAKVNLQGNLFVDGFGQAGIPGFLEPYVVLPPLNHPLTLFGGEINAASNPKSVGLPKIEVQDPEKPEDPNAKIMVFDVNKAQGVVNGNHLTDVSQFDLDILNGQTVDFIIDTVTIVTNSTVKLLQNIDIDASGTLSELTFQQTGGTVFAPLGANNGTFAIDGLLNAAISNLSVAVFGVLPIDLDDQSLELGLPLSGNYTLTDVDATHKKLVLEGITSLAVPLSLATNLSTSVQFGAIIEISSTVDLAASLTIALGYRLEQTITIPEPASVVLFGLGLAALVPLARRWRR